MNLSSSLWRNRTRTARLLTFAAVASLLVTGCASEQASTSRQAEGVAAVVGSEQPSASPTVTPGSDGDASTDSDETTDENLDADQASPEATPSEIDSESVEPTEPIEPTESTQPSDDRVASWLAYKTRNCVTNATSANIVLEWYSYMQNGKGEYLKPSELKRTLGPNAFDCAVSYAWVGDEYARFTINGKALTTANLDEFVIAFLDGPWGTISPDSPASLTWADKTAPGRSLTARATTTGERVQYDQIQVYPIDIRISETQTNSG